MKVRFPFFPQFSIKSYAVNIHYRRGDSSRHPQLVIYLEILKIVSFCHFDTKPSFTQSFTICLVQTWVYICMEMSPSCIIERHDSLVQ